MQTRYDRPRLADQRLHDVRRARQIAQRADALSRVHRKIFAASLFRRGFDYVAHRQKLEERRECGRSRRFILFGEIVAQDSRVHPGEFIGYSRRVAIGFEQRLFVEIGRARFARRDEARADQGA